ncbi:hypothetical protein MHY87_00330 [Microvirga sp. ACRRW]|uniref:M10 family metallopeptidase C-terminal domain-containing protein n=1 Tax=Microvirga sp. ACRRW TaxID=2918205 RepID=UPI001EF588B0|nr:hypothetical protein [Microvirga sp. ACRRW]MCG7391352.1 hypothetical protein [Microvirga sp. ACRRW]
MATITWTDPYSFDLKNVKFLGLFYANSYQKTSTLFSVTYGAGTSARDEFHGTGFTYDAAGIPTGGIVTSFGGVSHGKRYLVFSDLWIPATSIIAVGRTPSRSDDMELLKGILAGNDKITGGNGDYLWGKFVGDKLEGFDGNDVLYGRGGADRLYGGTGADTFVFKKVKESTFATNGRDTIYDFSAAQKDRIDLRDIDANTKKSGNQAFTFIGKAGFHKKPGELRYESKAGGVVIHGDTNGDGKTDFAITVKGIYSLSKGYFYL